MTAAGIAGLLEHGRRILPALLDEDVTAGYVGLRAATEQSDYRPSRAGPTTRPSAWAGSARPGSPWVDGARGVATAENGLAAVGI